MKNEPRESSRHDRRWLFVLVVASGFQIGCAEPGAPLGGPYGGNSEMLSPTDGGYYNVDATTPPPDPALSGGPGAQGAPNSWTRLFSVYLAAGTVGNCPTCHSEMSGPSAAYQWLVTEGYLGTPTPLLTNHGTSCLSWYGGNMPPGVQRPNDTIVQNFDAWVQAGALNN